MQPSVTFHKDAINFTELYEVDSTNNYAMGQLQKGLAHHGSVWIAHSQLAGKGQRDKSWKSNPGENVILSAAIDTNAFQPSRLFEIIVITALSIHRFFDKYSNGNATIKWPNDIYWRDRKAAGILIENIIQGVYWQFAVAGVGVNVNQTIFDNSIPNAVSLKQISGKNYDIIEMAKEISYIIFENFELLKSAGFDWFLNEYNNVLFKKGEIVKLKKGNRIFNSRIKEVNRLGHLVVESSFEETFYFGEVEWVLP